jgi:predicted MFS family arabinose efflux permease
MNTINSVSHTAISNSWSGVVALSVCAFALVASEFLPVSLLTPIASELDVTEGMAGQGIAISGIFAVITSLFISSLSGNLNRKHLLLGLTTAMGISGAVVAFAPNYLIYMLGRALIGVVVGGFWSMSAATAMRLVPTNQVPLALAIVNGGNALATVLAAPLGAWLGGILGWRSAFLCLVPIALIAFVWQWYTLPSMPVIGRSNRSGHVFQTVRLLKIPGIKMGLAASSMMFMGQFALFTYVRPFLESVTQVHGITLSFALLVTGVAGFIGTLLVGRVLQWGFYQTLVVIPLLMAATALGLIAAGEWFTAVIALLALWGLASTSAPVGWWAWIAKVFPNDAEAAGGLFVAIVQLSIALGSTLGGLLFDYGGYQSTFLLSATLLLMSALLSMLTAQTSTNTIHNN